MKELKNRFRRYRGKIIDRLPDRIRKPIILQYRLKIPQIRKEQKKLIEAISKRESVNVAFIVSSLSMWKYADILDCLKTDSRFNILIILYPFHSYSISAKNESISQLSLYFSDKGVTVVNAYDANNDLVSLFERFNPEILFYQMAYEGIYNNYLEAKNHKTRLICYSHYAIGTMKGGGFVNTPFHNYAWKIYVSTNIHKQIARKEATNSGENVVVVGEGNAQWFNKSNPYKCWKNNQLDTKKIIWAPHYSILEGHAFYHTSFLWLSDFMLHLADMYNGRLKIAFKPHPKLKTLMYEHPEWGKERTEAYYLRWEKGDNTILEEGYYADLFASSDALIHDSCSFIGEYMYTGKPSLFTSKDINKIREECNEFGQICLDLHYIAKNESEIIDFIDNVVFRGEDVLLRNRIKFFNDVLLISDGLTPGQRVYNDLLKEFHWK